MMQDEPCRECGVAICSHCRFAVDIDLSGVLCKSGAACPFYGLHVKYIAPPEVFR